MRKKIVYPLTASSSGGGSSGTSVEANDRSTPVNSQLRFLKVDNTNYYIPDIIETPYFTIGTSDNSVYGYAIIKIREEDYFSVWDSNLQSFASQFGVAIPTITNLTTLNNAFDILLPYFNGLQQQNLQQFGILFHMLLNAIFYGGTNYIISYFRTSTTNTWGRVIISDADDFGFNGYYLNSVGNLTSISDENTIKNILDGTQQITVLSVT